MEFRLGKIPVKVHGAFAITAVLLCLGPSTDPAKIAVFVVVMFISVLLHELGHALAGIGFGLSPRIDLHAMGGTTSWPQGRKIGWGKSMLISAAGPFTGIFLGGAAFLLMAYSGAPQHPLAASAANAFVWINAVWGLFNLAPMMPLDGGNILLAGLQMLTKGRGEKPTRYISIVVAAGCALFSLRVSYTWGAVLSGLFLFRNVQALRQVGRSKDEVQYFERLKEGFAALERKEGPAAIAHAEVVLENTNVPEVRFEAIRLLAYARVLEGHWGPLMSLVERCRLELGPAELERLEQAAAELDRPEEARRIKELREMPAAVAGFR